MISITDPQFRHPALVESGSRQAVLQLTFSDVDAQAARLAHLVPHIAAFTAALAEETTAFVREQIDAGVRLFVVHCEAGMSRSAGIAAAISQFYNHDDTFFQVHYHPNAWVRSRMLEALLSAAGGSGPREPGPGDPIDS